MTIFFQNSQIQIYRRRRIGSTDRYSMSATGTFYDADIQPADKIRTDQVQGKFGATFSAFVEIDCDVKENDEIHVGSKVYSVKGVSIWQDAGLLDSKELILISLDA